MIRESVREACETWRIQRQAGPVTSEALEAIVYRAAVPILTLLHDQAPEAVAELAPSVVRIMLAAAGGSGGGGARKRMKRMRNALGSAYAAVRPGTGMWWLVPIIGEAS